MEKIVSGKLVVFDVEDAELFDSGRWRLHSNNYLIQRILVDGKRVMHHFHRIVIGAKQGEFVDHINGNPLDNRRENLRICTHAQNMKNRKISAKNTSGFKGVYADRNRWRSEIRCDGKKYALGTFSTPDLAHDAYVRASEQLHKEFCRKP